MDLKKKEKIGIAKTENDKKQTKITERNTNKLIIYQIILHLFSRLPEIFVPAYFFFIEAERKQNNLEQLIACKNFFFATSS